MMASETYCRKNASAVARHRNKSWSFLEESVVGMPEAVRVWSAARDLSMSFLICDENQDRDWLVSEFREFSVDSYRFEEVDGTDLFGRIFRFYMGMVLFSFWGGGKSLGSYVEIASGLFKGFLEKEFDGFKGLNAEIVCSLRELFFLGAVSLYLAGDILFSEEISRKVLESVPPKDRDFDFYSAFDSYFSERSKAGGYFQNWCDDVLSGAGDYISPQYVMLLVNLDEIFEIIERTKQ